jgi:Putative cyclase
MCSPQAMQTVATAMTRRGLLGAGLAGAAVAAGAAAPAIARAGHRTVRFRKIVDLTHTAFPTFPNIFGLSMEVTPILTVEQDGVLVNRLTLPEHFGTHWDAPAHFVAGAPTAEQIPAEQLIAPLAVIDISERAARDPDAVVTPDDILHWERRHGTLPRGSFLAMYSGWEARLPGDGFLNADRSGTYHSPAGASKPRSSCSRSATSSAWGSTPTASIPVTTRPSRSTSRRSARASTASRTLRTSAPSTPRA